MKLFSINGHKINLVAESVVEHAIDDDTENKLGRPALLAVNSDQDPSKEIKVIMPGDDTPVVIPVWLAQNYAITVTKVFATGTSAETANIILLG